MKEDHTIEVPWKVWTKLGDQCKKLEIYGNHAFISSTADSGTLPELREAIEWYVEQLGGKVKWEK